MDCTSSPLFMLSYLQINCIHILRYFGSLIFEKWGGGRIFFMNFSASYVSLWGEGECWMNVSNQLECVNIVITNPDCQYCCAYADIVNAHYVRHYLKFILFSTVPSSILESISHNFNYVLLCLKLVWDISLPNFF